MSAAFREGNRKSWVVTFQAKVGLSKGLTKERLGLKENANKGIL